MGKWVMGIEEGTCWDEHWVLYGNQFDNKLHIYMYIYVCVCVCVYIYIYIYIYIYTHIYKEYLQNIQNIKECTFMGRLGGAVG